MSEPTEEATPRRLERARSEGDSGASGFAARAIGIFAAIALLPAAAAATATWFEGAMRDAIAQSTHPDLSALDASALGRALLGLTAPLLLAAAATTAAGTFLQTGGRFAPSRAAPRLDRLNLLSGMGRLFSATSAVGAIRSVFYGVSAIALVVFELRGHARDFAHVAGRPEKLGSFVLAMTVQTWERVALLGLGIAAIDRVVTRTLWLRRLRMTKEEVAREQRESHGDPQIKGARQRAFEALLASAASIDDASVIVTDGGDLACALRYVAGQDAAPVVIAVGGDLRARAKPANVPIEVDRDLAARLAALGVGASIPETLYDRIAELLADVNDKNVI